jgi:predicted RNA-binding protein
LRPYNRAVGEAAKTWILTGSLENFRINVERGFDVIGFKERRRNQAEEFEPGDEVFFYVTGVQAFGGLARVKSEMFEDRSRIWPERNKRRPQKSPPHRPEIYPWRVEAEPVLILPEEEFVPAEELATELEHVRKWPPDHWHLAFQGQLRTVGEGDAALLRERLTSAMASA